MDSGGHLHDVLTAGWADAADDPLFVGPGGVTLTHRDVDVRAGRFATALRDVGVGVGDRVLVCIPKSTDAVALYLACLRIGAVFVPLNTALSPEELAYHVGDAEPALTVLDPASAATMGPAVTVGALATLGAEGDGDLAAAADAAEPSFDVAPRESDDLAAMLYTSGTTGRPKGAMLTHRGLVANARALVQVWGFRRDDVLIHALPIFHVHGLFVALHCAMAVGATVRWLPKFDVDDVLEAIPDATVLMGVPTHYGRLLDDDRLDPQRCAGMRLFTSGSAPMTAAMHERFTARTGHAIVERYGMTEAGIITSNPLDGDRVPGTVGFALPGMELRVAGDAGVVEIRGPHLFAGYWRRPEQTAEAHTDDGWFVTGDVGSLDIDGRLTLEGRTGDMIISGGENVYPKEIERCLDEAPGVKESAVVGLPHPDFGEAVVAFVMASGDGFDEAIAAASLQGRLARFKQPKAYLVVDELPRNAMGKVQKAMLRNAHADLFTS